MTVTHSQITALAIVGRERSFTKAAKVLGVSQSAVTQHITALEKIVQSKLFIRTREGIELTPFAHGLYVLADKMWVVEKQFNESIDQLVSLKTGSISICISTARPAMEIIAAFKSIYPGIVINLQVEPWRDAIAMIERREVDVGIIMKPETWSDLKVLDFDNKAFVAVLPSQHPLTKYNEITFSQLTDEPFIELGNSSYTHHFVKSLLETNKISPSSTFSVDSYELLCESVRYGLGISVVLEDSFIPIAGIETRPIASQYQDHTYSIVCKKDKYSLLVLQHFFEAVKGLYPNASFASLSSTNTQMQ